MTLIIKQLVIRGEVIEDSSRFGTDNQASMDKVRELIEAAKKEIEREYQEKISQLVEQSSSR